MNTILTTVVCLVFAIGFGNAQGPVDGDLRLACGYSNHSGRVEIYHSQGWGTVCDDGFTVANARVVCRQLGFRNAVPQVWRSVFEGSGQILLDEVRCSGDEHMLSECSHAPWGMHDCLHRNDVGVECYGKQLGDYMRLVGGTESSGRLEVNDDGRWGLICSHGFDNNAAVVACRTLGFESNVAHVTFEFSSRYIPWYLTFARCNGNETSWSNCAHRPFGRTTYCGSGRHVGVICFGNKTTHT